MTAEIVILIMAFVFFLLSVFLFRGKGKWLIAGYNTASKEEQAKYDSKKLCKAAGSVCAVCGFMLCIMAYLGYKVDTGAMSEDRMLTFGLVFVAVIAVSVVAAIVYMNTKAKK